MRQIDLMDTSGPITAEEGSRGAIYNFAMDDAVSQYRAASEAANLDLMEVLRDVEVVSPISGRMVFRGHEDVEF